MWDFKKILGFLILTSLMLVKVSALHVYSHQDNESGAVENCHICDMALESQSADTITGTDTYSPIETYITIESKETIALPVQWNVLSDFHLFSRPPPGFEI